MSGSLRWGDLAVTGDARRREIRDRHGNGLDGVEVREGGRRLLVYFLRRPPRGLHPGNVRIEGPPGGRPVRAVEVRRAEDPDPQAEAPLIVELDHPGSAGSYLLRLVERRPDGTPGWHPHRGIDPRYAQVRFVFDVDAPQPAVRQAPVGVPAAAGPVSYLSRDYAGLRQLMLDRLAVTMPGWTERHEPDILITLVELLAYLGDDLSYYQDAVATEAYLATARNRVSVRRHARLTGYRLHEGSQARAWVCVTVTAPVSLPLRNVRFAAAGAWVSEGPPVLAAATVPAAVQQYTPLPAQLPGSGPGPVAELRPAHNAMRLWSWGERDSHLVAGATSAVLVDAAPSPNSPGTAVAGADRPRVLELRAGDVIILEQKRDPQAGGAALADPALRQAVRLTGVRALTDPLYELPLLEVQWAAEDALGFGLAVTAGGTECAQASGNVVLVAHGTDVTETVKVAAPALTRAGLGYAAPFPDPRAIARHQARVLRALYPRWREQVAQWGAQASDGTPLSAEQLAVLRAQVGSAELERLGLGGRRRRLSQDARADLDAGALAELLARARPAAGGTAPPARRPGPARRTHRAAGRRADR